MQYQWPINNILVSSSVSDNNLSLLIYGCMCVGTLGHIPRYMDTMSNNNKMLINNSSCYFIIRVVYIQITVTWDIRYIWGFPYLDYSFNVLILRSYNLGYTPGFIVFAFIGFLFKFLFLLLLLLYYIFLALPPVYYFTDLLLLPYYTHLSLA